MKTITTTRDIDATPSEVWDVLIDFASHAQWDPFFARIEGEAVEGASIKITARKGDNDGMSFSPEILDVVPGRLLRWKGKLLINGIFTGEHSFELVPLDNGQTRLNHGEKFTGILIPLMGKLLSDTEKGFHDFNSALAAEVATRRVQIQHI